MGQKPSKKPGSASRKTKTSRPSMDSGGFWQVVPELPSNVCGVLDDTFVITAPMDDLLERDFTFYLLYKYPSEGSRDPKEFYFSIIPRNDVSRKKLILSMNAFRKVLVKVDGLSVHFPKVKKMGVVSRLIFGTEKVQQEERDPEWVTRPILLFVTKKPQIFLGSLMAFANNGCVPTIIALHAGLGICRALAALHRAGFIHRFVTPYSFSFSMPFDIEKFANQILILDLTLATEWPLKPFSTITFVGSPRYASVRVHQKVEAMSPHDDIISVVFIVAEMISGKLPWRSVKDLGAIRKMKQYFHNFPEFKRLPTEIRELYAELIKKPALANIDHPKILNSFKKAIERREMETLSEVPQWLKLPTEDWY